MRIGLTYDIRQGRSVPRRCGSDHDVERDTPETVGFIRGALENIAEAVLDVGSAEDVLLHAEEVRSCDLVFNICEGSHGPSREALVPAILEVIGVPYTFSDPLTMCTALHKMTAKQLLIRAGLRSPDAVLVASTEELSREGEFRFPLFVKPSHEGTSKGIDSGAIVRDLGELVGRVDFVVRTYRQCALIEEYVAGLEYTVGIVGTGSDACVLGGVEIQVVSEDRVHGVFEKELCEEMVEYHPVILEAAVADAALCAYRALGCRDAGRVDVILRGGVPYVLEVNPLPGLHPSHSDLPIIARQAGVEYQELIRRIVASAAARGPSHALKLSDGHLRSLVTGARVP